MNTAKYLTALIRAADLTPISVVSAEHTPDRFIFYQVIGASPLLGQAATVSEKVSVSISAIAPRRAEAEEDLQKVIRLLANSYEQDLPHAGMAPSYMEVTALPVLLPSVQAIDSLKTSYQYTMTATLIFQT